MFWAACCLAFFGFLRSSEFTVPSLSAFSPAVHLTVADIAAETFSQPTSLRVNIKASKTDPFRKGCFIFIGRGRNPICVVNAVLAFLHRRGCGLGPLFIRENGQPLTRELLSTWLKRILGSAGVQCNFSSHSFRIGAATAAAQAGVPDHLIQTLGRWSSKAYQVYIRTPPDQITRLAK